MAQATTTKRSSAGTSKRRRNGTAASIDGLASAYLADVAAPVRDLLGAATDLGQFLQGAGTLTLNERRLLVEQALLMLDQNYVHLPFKVAMHAVSPVQRLRLLKVRLDRQTPATMGPEWKFHAEMSEIFHSVRDIHTNYMLPMPYAGKVAFLPFQIEHYVDANGPQYVVTRVVQGFSAPGLGAGARVTHWNGVPIDRAVHINANRFAGSNLAARHARGVDSLTIRPLRIHLPPDEEWVTVTYIGIDNAEHELREKWLIADNLPSFVAAASDLSSVATAQGIDVDGDETSRAKVLLFAPHVVAQRQEPDLVVQSSVLAAGEDLPTNMAGVFRARPVVTPSGTFGHIRIFTFNVQSPDAFVDEFVRLIGLLPQNGLIVDVRGNGGGHIHASEFTLQTLTPRHITPEPAQFINTPLNIKLVGRHKDNPSGLALGSWFPSMDQATETGAAFSGAFSITPEDGANAVGQQYFGPVVLITDARCYSATDIFAAGFKDHVIGTILGVDDNTGAGGANVWEHALLKRLMEMPSPEKDTPYKALPKQANMRVSIRRTLRVGAAVGTPVEDLGVVPDVLHQMTRNDVLNGNVDLLNRAGQILAAGPVRKLDVTATTAADGTMTLQIDAANIDRIDVYGDDRPRASMDLAGTPVPVMVPGLPAAQVVRVEGYASGQLVAARTIEV